MRDLDSVPEEPRFVWWKVGTGDAIQVNLVNLLRTRLAAHFKLMASDEPQDPKPAKEAAGTGFRTGEDNGSRWRNLFAALTGQMNAEGLAQYKKDIDLRHEAEHCKRCETNRDYLLQYSS